MKFNEIKSLKRVHKTHELIGTDNIINSPGIVHPFTGEILTIGDAISSRILDVRTGKLVISPDGTQVTIEDALKRGIIDPKIAEKLYSPCGVQEDGRTLTLLEAIQREIYEAEHGFIDPSEKKIKVIHSTSLDQAIDDGKVDLSTGTYKSDTGEVLTTQEAFQKGYLYTSTKVVTVRPGAVSLYDAINQGLIDEKTGWIVERNSGNKYQIDAAVKTNIIDGDIREIVDPKTDNKITIIQAIEKGIINPKLGKYVLAHEKIPFIEAKRRQYIIKPMTLKDVCDNNLIDTQSKIFSPLHQTKLTLLEAIGRGVVDSDTIKCIVNTHNNELNSLNDAIAQGVILPEGKFRDTVTNETCSIPDAVRRGYITSVTLKSIFDIDGFRPPQDNSDYISFNAARAKGYISSKNNGSLVTNLKSGKLIRFADGVKTDFVKPEVYELLIKKIGIYEDGVGLTVIEAVFKGYIDPKTGNFVDVKKDKVVPLNDAIAQNLITPEGAALLNSLLSIAVSTQTTSKTVQRYVTVSGKNVSDVHMKMTYSEAIQKGLIDNDKQTFTDPDTKVTMPIVHALTEGLLSPDTDEQRTTIVQTGAYPKTPKQTTIKVIRLEQQPQQQFERPNQLNRPEQQRQMEIDRPQFDLIKQQIKDYKFPTKSNVTTQFLTNERQICEKQVYELPTEGWNLSDAINQKLFDPVTGLFTIPGTDRLASFEECVSLKLINPNSATVIDPVNQRKITVLRSLDKKILNNVGRYLINNKRITMKEAITNRYVILESPMDMEETKQRLLQVTKESGKPDKVEVSNVFDQCPPTYTEVVSETTIEPIKLSTGVIFDPSTAIIIDAKENRAKPLMVAIKEKTITPELIQVKDPNTGVELDINEAIRKNVIDPETGDYLDKSGRRISINDATKYGIMTVIGAPIVGVQKIAKIINKIVIIDPKTKEEIPVEDAYKRGLIDKNTYEKYQTEALIADAKQTEQSVTIKDPTTGKTYTAHEAIQNGLLKPEDLANVSEELIKLPNDGTTPKVLSRVTISLQGDQSLADKTRNRITIEPKYQVAIGRAHSISPDREAKKVVLQKLRKKIVKPKDAAQKGIIDRETADILDKKDTFRAPDGETLCLQEAVEYKKLDGEKGEIVDPQRGDILTINQAISRGILDPTGTNQILVPLNKSLSIPELYNQGLIDPETNKVVHPETGAHLTLKDAIVCDIVDPLSKLVEPAGRRITLEKALESGTVDEVQSVVKTDRGNVDLQTAVESRIFVVDDVAKSDIPPAGMTFPVAVKRGLIDFDKKEVIHPITKERIPLEEAINSDFLMAVPSPLQEESIQVSKAMDDNLIDPDKGTFTHPTTGELIPISEAVETGLLVIKPSATMVSFDTTRPVTTVTETVTSIHTVTTKTIGILPGYALVNTNQVQNLSTGELIPIDDAKTRGIIVNESETKNVITLKDIKMSFAEALNKGLVDMNAGLYTDPQSGEKIAIEDALKGGLLEAAPMATDCTVTDNAQSTTTKTTELNIAEAFSTIYDEETAKFHDPEQPEKLLTFTEALEKDIIDPNSLVYDVNSQKPITVEQAVDKGLIDAKTGKVKDEKSGMSVDFKKAAKMGLIAVIGGLAAPVVAPVLAGAAAVRAVKELREKNKTKTPVTVKTASDSSTAPMSIKAISITEKEVIKPTIKAVIAKETKPVIRSDETSIEIIGIEPYKSDKIYDKEVIDDEVAEIKKESDRKIDLSEYEKLPIGDAITQQKIIPQVCRITFQDNELPYTVQDGLNNKEISPLDIVVVINKNKVVLLDESPKAILTISKELTPLKLAELGYFNMRTYTFIDAETQERISFEELIYIFQVIDPSTILIKDLTKKYPTYVTLDEGIRRLLIDRNSGQMVDPKTGKRISFFEAIKLKWIINVADKPKEKLQALTLEEIIDTDQFDSNNVQVTDSKTGEKISLVKALNTNVIDPKSVTIRDPKNMKIVPYYEAVDHNIVDPNRGLIINTITKKSIDFPTAFIEGLILTLPRPIALSAFVQNGNYDKSSGKLKDPLTKQLIPLKEAINRNLIDDKITQVKDVKTGNYITLSDALRDNLINSNGTLTAENGQLVPLDKAIDLKLIQTKQIIFNFLQAILLNYYSPRSGKILNPCTGEEITIQKAIEYKLLDPVTSKIKDDQQGKIVEVKEAIESKLLDPERGVLTNPSLTLDQAYMKGYILSTVLPWSLQETLAQRVYEPKSGQLIINNSNLTLMDAIKKNIINPEVLTVRDPTSGDIITLNDAMKLKIIDPIKGQVIDPSTNQEINLYEAQERGIIVPFKSQISLPEAVFKGYYDPNTGKFVIPQNKEKLKAQSAINRGYIDPSSTLVTIDEEVYTFDQAVDDGIIDTVEGVVVIDQTKANPLDFTEAFERGLLVEVTTPMSLSEAIAKSLYDHESHLFLDPNTGNYLTLIEAIEINVIDPNSVNVKDTKSGVWRKLTLVDAIHNNYVDGNTGNVKDYSKGDNYEVSLQEAFDLGILIDSKAAVSIQRAIHQGLYDETNGKILDPSTDRKITLHEAIRRFIINPLLPCYFNKNDGKLYNLSETCRLGVIDKRNGTFKDQNNVQISLTKALNLGYIVDIETANFGLYEAIEMGIYDETTNNFVHLSTGGKYNLEQACKAELINPLESLVRNPKLNKYVKLPEAIEMRLIDPRTNVYVLPNKQTINLLEAQLKGYIVTSRNMLTVKEAVQCGLYRPDSGKFVDPSSGEFHDLSQALQINFIDPTTTALKENASLKSLNSAIADGNIDVEKGRVLDSKSKKTYNLDKALERGLLVTLDKPLVVEVNQKTIVVDLGKSKPRECTLDEAIKFELVNPDVAVVKDPQSGKFKLVADAITDKIVDVNKMVVFDNSNQNPKVKSLVITYDQTVPIYLKYPLTFEQAIEKQLLDVQTGKFTEAQSNETVSLKESITLGYIDPDTALVKDTNKKKLIKLPEGFRKGLVDAEKGNVLDSSTSKLHSLTSALDVGLLVTPSRGFTLLETIIYGLYNPVTGSFNDPFVNTNVIDRKRLTLSDAIDNNLIDPSTTVIKDSETGAVIPLLNAIDNQLVDSTGGKIHDKNDNKYVDFVKAQDRGLILPAEQRVSLFVILSKRREILKIFCRFFLFFF